MQFDVNLHKQQNNATSPIYSLFERKEKKKKKGREPKIPNENLTETEEKEDKGCA